MHKEIRIPNGGCSRRVIEGLALRRIFLWAMSGIFSIATMAKAIETPAVQSTDAAAAAGNLFAIDLYGQIRQSEGNICISPYSISSALQMASAGAAGTTAQQMLSVLHWTAPAGDLPAASAALTADLLGRTSAATTRELEASGEAQISIANALFGQRGYPYNQLFLDLLAKQYAAPMQDVDFKTQPRQACDQINHWAAAATHDRIQNAVPASAITPATRLVLVDAIYFKAAWLHAFRKSATQDQPFYPGGIDPVTVPMMQEKESLDYMENDSLQAVQLPYHGDYSMLILLPRQRDGLAGLEKSLTADALNGWIGQLASRSVQVYLPKFKMEGQYSLNDTLIKLGMSDAFNPTKADFSGMTSADKLCIDQVIHKTFISADEVGTEAAAVSAITMTMTAIMGGHRPEAVVFRADHPFLFVLRHRSSGAILFMGRIVHPQTP